MDELEKLKFTYEIQIRKEKNEATIILTGVGEEVVIHCHVYQERGTYYNEILALTDNRNETVLDNEDRKSSSQG